MPTPGILTLADQQGDAGLSLEDLTLQRQGERVVRNIEAKDQNRAALWNIGGRVGQAGIQTGADYRKVQEARKAGQDTSKLPGVDKNGEFIPMSDFAKNLVNPYARYMHLAHQLGSGGDQDALQHTPKFQNAALWNGDNAFVRGSIIQNIMSSGMGPPQ